MKPLRSSIVEQTAGSLKNYISKEKRGMPFSRVLAKTQELVAQELVHKK